jgi:hypothetical protein
MTRYAAASVLALVSLTSGCGGSSTPARTASAPASDPAPATDPAAAASSAPAAPSNDGWEGEGEAKGNAAPAAAAPEATPSSGAKQPEETRTVEVIAKVIKAHRAEIRQQCYEPARKDLPSLQGDMVIHLVLDPAGKVKTAELNLERSTLKSAAVADCAAKLLEGVAFPPSSRGLETVVNYPFNFMPGGPAPR